MADIPETLQAGLEHHRAGRLLQAEHMYRRVLQIHPRHAGAIHLLGLIAFQVGKPELAAEYLTEAIKIDAFRATYPADLGEIFRAQGKIPEAIDCYRKALSLDSEMADAHNNLGTLLQAAGSPTEAIACFREARRLRPGYAEALGNLGVVLQAQGQLAEAQAALEEAITLTPEHAEAYLRLGECLQVQGELLNALACFRKATRLQPDLAAAQCRCAQVRLAQGDFINGWRDFEWRLQCPQSVDHGALTATWNGADLHGQRVLIQAEQGLGDILQFVRYLPLVAGQRGGEVMFEVPPQLIPLLEPSGFKNLVPTGEPVGECAVHAPLLSLPRLLGTTLETIPAPVPYLSAPPDLIATWRAKLAESPGFKVGIAWQGDPANALDRFRSIPLSEFQPLADAAGVRLVSLQKKHGLDQLEALGDRLGVVRFGDEVDEARGAFVDTAAIIKNLDLVITSETSIAHLAGALGAPVWLALSTAADWRWLQNRDDSPWYPTMRLFRQAQLDDWSTVFTRMAAELTALVAEGRSHGEKS